MVGRVNDPTWYAFVGRERVMDCVDEESNTPMWLG